MYHGLHLFDDTLYTSGLLEDGDALWIIGLQLSFDTLFLYGLLENVDSNYYNCVK